LLDCRVELRGGKLGSVLICAQLGGRLHGRVEGSESGLRGGNLLCRGLRGEGDDPLNPSNNAELLGSSPEITSAVRSTPL
jgi:hypothetical protein